jgi:hypothetical protein
LRNVYRPEDMAAHGFVYESLGRGKLPPEYERASATQSAPAAAGRSRRATAANVPSSQPAS